MDKILGKFIFLRSFDEPKKSKKSEPKLAFGHVIADYIVRNYTMVVIPELFKWGNFFWDTRQTCIAMVYLLMPTLQTKF